MAPPELILADTLEELLFKGVKVGRQRAAYQALFFTVLVSYAGYELVSRDGQDVERQDRSRTQGVARQHYVGRVPVEHGQEGLDPLKTYSAARPMNAAASWSEVASWWRNQVSSRSVSTSISSLLPSSHCPRKSSSR